MARTLTVTVPATVANLGPGFDALGLALPLRNRFTFTDGKPDVVCTGPFGARLPAGRDNLVLRAVQRVCDWAGQPMPGVQVTIAAHLPPGSGLGSSATAVVAGVVAADRWLGLSLDDAQRLDLCADIEGHPDNVAPALLGGIAIAAMEDQVHGRRAPRHVHWLPIAPPRGWQLVVATPDLAVDTEVARAMLPDTVGLRDAVWNLARTGLLVAALHQGRLDVLAEATRDRLHEDKRLELVPGGNRAKVAAVAAGAAACVLSGSGPSLVAFLADAGPAERVQEAMRSAFRATGVACEVYVFGIEAAGAILTP